MKRMTALTQTSTACERGVPYFAAKYEDRMANLTAGEMIAQRDLEWLQRLSDRTAAGQTLNSSLWDLLEMTDFERNQMLESFQNAGTMVRGLEPSLPFETLGHLWDEYRSNEMRALEALKIAQRPSGDPPDASSIKSDSRVTDAPRERASELLDDAANALSRFEIAVRGIGVVIKTADEYKTLQELSAKGEISAVNTWLVKRTKKVVKECKEALGIANARRRKNSDQKRGYKIAMRVAAALSVFEQSMRDKKTCKGRNRAAKLSRKYKPNEVESIMASSSAISAACMWVSIQEKIAQQTVANYYSAYRCLIPQ
jgi:hypothetical protein